MTIRIPLDEFCEFLYGESLKEDRRSPGKVPVYGSNGIVGWHSQAITAGPTIIIDRKGSIGEVNWNSTPCFPIDTTYYADKAKKPCDLKWLYYNLLQLDLTRFNKSAAVPGLNRNDAYEQPILFPSLPEQKKISRVLDQSDHLRRIRRYSLELTGTFLSATFLEIFRDPQANPNGWPESSLSDLCLKFSDGPFGSNLKTSHYTPVGIRVIRLQNIGVGEFLDDDKAFISEDHFKTLHKHECLPGDVLIGTLGHPNLRACIRPNNIATAMNKADCIQARPNPNKANSRYLCWLLNIPGTLYLVPGLVHGQSRDRVSMGRLANLPVPVPPLPLQEKFSQLVDRHDRLKAGQQEALRQDEHLLQTLLHQAFTET